MRKIILKDRFLRGNFSRKFWGWRVQTFLGKKNTSKGGSYGNKILYENLKFFDKIAVEDFVTLLMGKKSC